MKSYTPTIGIEVHAELKTATKMFCDSKNAPHEGAPNSHVCPICMGHPGTLPVINKKAVEHVLKVGIALGSELASYTEFDRKNYFYPDIPKGYQISQYLYPLVIGGELNGVKITRVHLEEDTARSQHDQGEGSIIDYNRAGVPLMELVTEPVIHDAKTAGDFARELQLLLRTLGVSDANMEKGEMRVEANISVSATEKFGTKVEVKNLNSFRSVEDAITYEIKRQSTLIEEGGNVIQETRGWDEVKGKTFSQRAKESANDYRYFPDPDLPKMNLQDTQDTSDIASMNTKTTLDVSSLLSRLHAELPILPKEKRLKYKDLGLTIEQIEMLISDLHRDQFFNWVSDAVSSDDNLARLSANYIISDLMSLCDDFSVLTQDSARQFAALMQMVVTEAITSRVAKDILADVVFKMLDPNAIVAERGLTQSNSAETVLPIVSAVIAENTSVVEEYKSGKDSVLQFLVGQGMKLSKGSANPKILAELFTKHIREEKS